jgi:23S rRNA (uracil1939-C5)-methyltransferase
MARALVFRHLVPLTAADIESLRAFGERHDVQVFSQPNPPQTVLALWPERPAPLYYTLPEFDVRMEFDPLDFIQVNSMLNRTIVGQAIRLLDPRPDETVLDLFCGLGNFSLPLARRAARVIGVEAEPALLDKARRAADLNRLGNIEFLQANLFDEQAPLPWADAPIDKWLIDPPRSGAVEIVKRLDEDNAPRRLLYISCNPATLARDAEVLVHVKGYRLTSAGVADMFPHTSHVEALALFERP